MSKRRKDGRDAEVIIGPIANEMIACLQDVRGLCGHLLESQNSSNVRAAEKVLVRIDELMALHDETAEILHKDPIVGSILEQERKTRDIKISANALSDGVEPKLAADQFQQNTSDLSIKAFTLATLYTATEARPNPEFICDNGNDRCVRCRGDTGVSALLPIQRRHGYEVGSGQYCSDCR